MIRTLIQRVNVSFAVVQIKKCKFDFNVTSQLITASAPTGDHGGIVDEYPDISGITNARVRAYQYFD